MERLCVGTDAKGGARTANGRGGVQTTVFSWRGRLEAGEFFFSFVAGLRIFTER